MTVLARGTRVVLRRPEPADRERFRAAVASSEDLHGEWVNPPASDTAYELWLEASRRPTVEAHLATTRDAELVGVVNINNIIRGSLQSGSLGYYGFVPHAGCGLMREAVSLVITRAFDELGLHRVEANIQPGNERSRRLVESLGFGYEGFSPKYLRIGGRWRDHDRFALVKSE